MVPQRLTKWKALHVTDLASTAHCFHSLVCNFPLSFTSFTSLRSLYVFFPSPSLTLYLNPFHLLTLPLPARSFSLFAVLRARPSPSFPFSRETLTTQSRFASYSHKPLKASHFRIFHSRVAHQLCHSHRCGHTSQRADTHRHAPHTHTHPHISEHGHTFFSFFFFFFFALHVNPKTCHNW